MKIIWNEEPTAPEAPFFAVPEQEEPPQAQEDVDEEMEKPRGFLREKLDRY